MKKVLLLNLIFPILALSSPSPEYKRETRLGAVTGALTGLSALETCSYLKALHDKDKRYFSQSFSSESYIPYSDIKIEYAPFRLCNNKYLNTAVYIGTIAAFAWIGKNIMKASTPDYYYEKARQEIRIVDYSYLAICRNMKVLGTKALKEFASRKYITSRYPLDDACDNFSYKLNQLDYIDYLLTCAERSAQYK